MTTIAYCFASGHIGFTSSKLPGGALPLIKGEDKSVRDFIGGVSRHAYDGETLLVPGLPEAEDQSAAFTAFMKFKEWIDLLWARKQKERVANG